MSISYVLLELDICFEWLLGELTVLERTKRSCQFFEHMFFLCTREVDVARTIVETVIDVEGLEVFVEIAGDEDLHVGHLAHRAVDLVLFGPHEVVADSADLFVVAPADAE